MIVLLDKQTRIRGTDNCWQLEREAIVKGKEQWRPQTYHSTFAHALQTAARREIRTHHAEGLAESIAATEAILKKYRSIMDATSAG